MHASLDMMNLTAAFLAATPAWRQPPQGSVRWPLGSWMTALVIGAVLLTTTLPVVIALNAYRAEDAFRARCAVSGGRVAFTGDLRQPYDCTHG